MGSIQANIWVGTPNVCTPLHYDAAHNLLYQAQGSKRVWVFPPHASADLVLYPLTSPGSRSAQNKTFNALAAASLHSLLDDANEQARRVHPDAKVIDVHPGSVLLLPPWWFHLVCVTSTTSTHSTPNNGNGDGGGGGGNANNGSRGGIALSFSFWLQSQVGAKSRRLQQLAVPFSDAWDPGKCPVAGAVGCITPMSHTDIVKNSRWWQ